MEENKKKKIKDPVKAIIAFVLFVAVTALISVFILFPMRQIYNAGDGHDIAFVGASQWRWQLNPAEIDRRLASDCAVLAGDGFSMENRYDLVRSAFTNADVDTIVLEISCNRMAEFDEGLLIDNIFCINQLYSPADRLNAIGRYISFADDEFDALYATSLDYGLTFWRSIVLNGSETTFALKGCTPRYTTINLKLSAEDAKTVYNETAAATAFLPNNEKRLREIIEYCHANKINIIIVTAPLSEQKIWRFDGWDNFHEQMMSVTDEYGVPYYDFNLLKNRSQYYNDECSFTDTDHLNAEYSLVFSRMVSEITDSSVNNKPSAYEFYDSYAEAKANSVYAEK